MTAAIEKTLNQNHKQLENLHNKPGKQATVETIPEHTAHQRPSYLERSAKLRHDITNVVSVVQMRLYILKRTRTLSDEQLDIFDHCINRLGTLLDCWKQLDSSASDLDHDPVVEFDISDLVTQILDTYHPLMQSRNQRLIFRGQRKTILVTGPIVQYERLIDNLVSNACKYTPDDGAIEVSLRCPNGRVHLSVSDRGIGIPEEELAQIFDPYYRASTARLHNISGSGLGLAIVKEVVDQLGGEISVKSQIDAGTSFQVTLPVACA